MRKLKLKFAEMEYFSEDKRYARYKEVLCTVHVDFNPEVDIDLLKEVKSEVAKYWVKSDYRVRFRFLQHESRVVKPEWINEGKEEWMTHGNKRSIIKKKNMLNRIIDRFLE